MTEESISILAKMQATKPIEVEDLPLIGDGLFVILCLVAGKILSTEEKSEIKGLLCERFAKQDFDIAISEKIADMISNAIYTVTE